MIELLVAAVIGLVVIASALTAFMYVVKTRMNDRLASLQELSDRVENLDDKLEDTRDYILEGDLERQFHRRDRRKGAND